MKSGFSRVLVNPRIASIISVLLLWAASHLALSQSSSAASLIRDTEVETTIRTYATPLFKAAGLKGQDVKIYIVKDNSLNAFVTGGQKLFINTGLILSSDSANQIIGVIAHETGHIAGGHLSRIHDALARSSTSAIIAAILGTATALATERGDVGGVIAAAGTGVATRNFLAYSRTQESSADHAAMTYLDRTKQSSRGLLEFMQKLGDQELLSTAQQDPYVRSHPLTRDRITTIEEHVANSPYSDQESPPEYVIAHKMMKAKIYAFLNPYGRTVQMYKPSDNSAVSRYARAVAEFRRGKLDEALQLIDGLIGEVPSNAYFHELKGQMLFESGRVQPALASYQRALELLPNAPLVRRELARVQLETNDPALLAKAASNLEIALSREKESAFTWKLLAIAHGKKGDHGRASLALAEEALLKRKPEIARFHAGKAERLFPRGSREWLHAEDLRLAVEELERVLKRRANK